MTTPYEVLSRITATAAPGTGTQRCEMCADPILEPHSHVVDVAARQVMCVCRGCHLLFTDADAVLRYRAVPDRYRSLPGFGSDRRIWDALQLPVGLAFLFRNSALDRVVAFYPGPAGATESELDLAAWQDIVDADSRLRTMTDDVEVLLMRSVDHGVQAFLIPIDRCYEFVGGLRVRWRGFDGGQDVSSYIAEFFDELAARAKPMPR